MDLKSNLIIGGLSFAKRDDAKLAIGIILVLSNLCNMITVEPVCYPIVAETPSGRLRYKIITIGWFVYNLNGIVEYTLTPRMLPHVGKPMTFPVHSVNLLTHATRLELEIEGWLYLRRHTSSMRPLVLLPSSRDQGPYLW